MITSPAFAGKRYAVLGLARSGLATVDALVASGASVTAWDESETTRETFRSSRAKSRGDGADSEVRPSTSLGTNEVVVEDILETDLTGLDGVVVSPGVPLNRHPIAAKAREAGVPVIGDIELFALARPSLPPHKVVGITGTNGKSTTTALVHHILKTAGVPTTMGGNIGLPILAQDPLPEGGVYVLELSSYQIDLTYSLDCDVAVLLNVTPDHLDRYESFEAYAASKARLFEMQHDKVAIISADDAEAHRIAQSLPRVGSRHRWEGKLFHPTRTWQERVPGLTVVEVSWRDSDDQWRSSPLMGPHNAQNLVAAMATCRVLGITREQNQQGLETFNGLPHRMEHIRWRNDVVFVNDSKATNPDSAAPALAAYPHIHWILGGKAKTDDLGPCADHLDHVRAAYVIGESGPMFARLLEGKVPVSNSGTLDVAVQQAAAAAAPGEVVLLSPACASFDQFRDFEARGEAFRKAVEALA